MKLTPLILLLIFILPGMHLCEGSFACQEVEITQTDLCQESESKHTCCELPVKEDHSPAKEGPCTDGCHCYCCVMVIAQATESLSLSSQPETERQNRWEVSIHSQDFTHLIWQPPQAV